MVSIVMPTYNHERYIGAALDSVLAQTFNDFELIVVDDGSTDTTGAIARAYRDPRIRYIHQRNQGPGAALNAGIARSRGSYVAISSGDDICLPRRLAVQVEVAREMAGCVIFSHVIFVDDEGRQRLDRHFASDYFNVPNRSRAEWLRTFFFSGNCLSAISAFVERSALDATGLHDPVLMQLQDFDLWARLAVTRQLHVIQEPLVGYRIRDDGANLSSPGDAARWRTQVELGLMFDRFFERLDLQTLKEAFSDLLRRPDFREGPERRAEEAFLLLRSPTRSVRLLGVSRLHRMLNSAVDSCVLHERYQFDAIDLIRLTGEHQFYADDPEPSSPALVGRAAHAARRGARLLLSTLARPQGLFEGRRPSGDGKREH